VISYVAHDGVVSAVLGCNAAGEIASLSCGPAKEAYRRKSKPALIAA